MPEPARELSEAAGTDPRTVERLESGATSNVTVKVLLRLLTAAKMRLQLITPDGICIDGDLHPDATNWRDAAGRRQPAHLLCWWQPDGKSEGDGAAPIV